MMSLSSDVIVDNATKRYLDGFVKNITPPSTIWANQNGGTLILGGLDELISGNATFYDHVISILPKSHLYTYMHPTLSGDYTRLCHQYELHDNYDQDLTGILETVVEQIHNSLEKGRKVYIHCFMGLSRSAACVVAYLMKYQTMNYPEAMAYVKKNRLIQINFGFMLQLQDFEKSLRKPRSSTII